MPPTRSGPPVQRPAPRPATPGRPTPRTGPLGAVPCPHCGHKLDMRPMAGVAMGGVGEGDVGIEVGAVWSCDHCRQKFKITALDRIVVVKVAPMAPAVAAPRPGAPPPRRR